MSPLLRSYLAADKMNLTQCLELASKTSGRVTGIKIHSLWDEEGPGVVKKLQDAGAGSVWVDLKLNDIPETVALRAKAVREAGADTLTIMASGEIDMMLAAKEHGPLFVFAVTVLTTLDDAEVEAMYAKTPKAAALYFARLARLAGVNGVVCSAKEVGTLKKRRELRGIEFVTPGTRSPGEETHDQKRVDTPANALKNGTSIFVFGRQVTQAQDLMAALDKLDAELSAAEMEMLARKAA